MADEKTDLIFKALFLLEDFRQLLRETAPRHLFGADTKIKAIGILDEAVKIIQILKGKI